MTGINLDYSLGGLYVDLVMAFSARHPHLKPLTFIPFCGTL
ncbi:hypothetical protein D1AOALGA4SA_5646 [Olavius algarvensis Delta 1 endosymbiont]|nr:hypothetical protein D1AOALGA4SA_5646 [Olavius algarvensis Delta 1 endosymbiont]